LKAVTTTSDSHMALDLARHLHFPLHFDSKGSGLESGFT